MAAETRETRRYRKITGTPITLGRDLRSRFECQAVRMFRSGATGQLGRCDKPATRAVTFEDTKKLALLCGSCGFHAVKHGGFYVPAAEGSSNG